MVLHSSRDQSLQVQEVAAADFPVSHVQESFEVLLLWAICQLWFPQQAGGSFLEVVSLASAAACRIQ